MDSQTICIIGGTGFVGRHLIYRLAQAGHRLRVLTRRRERHRNLIVIPEVTLVETNIHNSKQLRVQMAGCETVINLAGILNEGRPKQNRFQLVHAELPRRIIEAANAIKVRRFLHMSALNASSSEPNSCYLRTKGEGEDLVHQAAGGLKVTSFRPSVIFGPDDDFFNRFQGLLRMIPLMFPLACPESRFAPVYVGDVAKAFSKALSDKSSFGKRYELCGPQQFTLRELVQYTARNSGLKRKIIGLGNMASRLQAHVLGLVPGKPFSLDNYYSLQHPSVCTDPGLERLGITPTPIDAIVPMYLGDRHTRARYHDWRRYAGRG